MDKNNEYLNSKKADNIEKIGIIALLFISLFLYVGIIRRFIMKIQWDLICNSDTLLITPSAGLLIVVEILGAVIIIMTTVCFSIYKIKQSRDMKIKCNTTYNKNSGVKAYIITMIICLIMISVSIMSYCRVDRDAIYYRDVKTLFLEKKYSWEDLKSVEINYLHKKVPSKHSSTFQYLLNFEKFSVDIKEAGISTKLELIDEAERTIHGIVKAKNIPVYKNINKYDYIINNFLNLIGE